ncbi:hypothetical protein [Myceligenerans crystallogenes]|uniref:Uncharacterized protein n=1 Tax=Myceligenerans crystallogenes TaxID=316335 RepID=A0ABP4ZJD6_9MICO
MESAAGLSVMALFVLWLGYLVPQMIRQRAVLAQARAGDRFSGRMRVVAVSGEERRSPRRGGAMTTGHGGSRLTGARPAPAPHAPEDVETPEQLRALAGQRARRAVRARRRLALTLVLLLATVAAGVAVVVVPLHWGVTVVPGALLVAVLAMGRRAAVVARRAEQAVETARREARQRATQARALANGGPYAPRNRLRVTGAPGEAAGGAEVIPAARKSGGVLDELLSVPEPAGAKVVDETGAPAAEDSAAQEAADAPGVGGGAWEPVPVPLPTYVTKPPARRLPARPAATAPAGDGRAGAGPADVGRSAAAQPADEKAVRLAAAVRASAGIPTGETPAVRPEREHTPEQDAAAASSSGTVRPPEEDELVRPAPRVRDETLAQPLEQILARRRAAG